jgi:ankyrin repeat protein
MSEFSIFERLTYQSEDAWRDALQNLSLRDKKGRNILYYAIIFKRLDVLEHVIEHGIDINSQDLEGETPIFEAIKRSETMMFKRLVMAGAHLHVINKRGETPFHYVVQSGDLKMLSVMISEQVLHVDNFNGQFPIHYGVMNLKLRSVQALIQEGYVSRFILDGKQRSLLHYSVRLSSTNMTEWLLQQGLDVNLMNEHFETPLLIAVLEGHYEMIQVLLKYKPFIDIPDRYQLTAYEASEEMDEIRELLNLYKESSLYQKKCQYFGRIHSILKRDHALYLSHERHLTPDPYDEYHQQSKDYIKQYKLKW